MTYRYSLFKLLHRPLPDYGVGANLYVAGFGTETTVTQEGDVTVIRDPVKKFEVTVLEKAEDILRSLKENPNTLKL